MQADRQVHKRKPVEAATYRAVQLSFVIHPQIESTVHPSNAYQAHRQAYEFQNTCERITQLFRADLKKRMKEYDHLNTWKAYLGKIFHAVAIFLISIFFFFKATLGQKRLMVNCLTCAHTPTPLA